MVEITSYAPGTPSWVDLGSPDLDASTEFYGALFGWEAHKAPQPEAGGYTMFQFNGKWVAGVGPLFNTDQPPAWSTYISVADADATVAAATAAGATVLMAPMDVLDVGRMAVLLDPVGAAISVWQPRAHAGAQLVNEPGAFCWNELATRSIEPAKNFYSNVFGWGAETNSINDVEYTEWKLDGKSIGGMIKMNEQWPAGVPSHWMVYFAVTDTDAAAAKAEDLGGKISVPPTTIQVGRFAVLNDPQGAAFSVIAMSEPST
ncbi:VOC family protein [Frankia sp. Cppng1_Ct_nod]|uniref:VOC family protein n=1 Tax=Frankia sp. Cppng1_Ct_nod TaxID=2897162 RepID=UPI0010417735|nr:VOC family protein [Frankia sp. Cppng1_Ct_nod]